MKENRENWKCKWEKQNKKTVNDRQSSNNSLSFGELENSTTRAQHEAVLKGGGRDKENGKTVKEIPEGG